MRSIKMFQFILHMLFIFFITITAIPYGALLAGAVQKEAVLDSGMKRPFVSFSSQQLEPFTSSVPLSAAFSMTGSPLENPNFSAMPAEAENAGLLPASEKTLPLALSQYDPETPSLQLSGLQSVYSQKTFSLAEENPTVQAQATTGLHLIIQQSEPVSAMTIPVQLSQRPSQAAHISSRQPESAAGVAGGNENKIVILKEQPQGPSASALPEIPVLDTQELPVKYESTKIFALSQIESLPSEWRRLYWKALTSSENALAGKADISEARLDLALATSEATRLHGVSGDNAQSNNHYRNAMGLSALIETRLLVAFTHANINSNTKETCQMQCRENIMNLARQSCDPQVCAMAAVVLNNEVQDKAGARTLAAWAANWNFNRFSPYAYANDISFMYKLAEAQALDLDDREGALTTCIAAKRMWTDEGETAWRDATGKMVTRLPEWDVLPLSPEEKAYYRSLHAQTLLMIDPEGSAD